MIIMCKIPGVCGMWYSEGDSCEYLQLLKNYIHFICVCVCVVLGLNVGPHICQADALLLNYYSSSFSSFVVVVGFLFFCFILFFG